MPLKPGKLNDYNNSMAAAMESAFISNWPSVMGNDVPAPPSNDQMKLMFIAIAQGVVQHLNANADSFKVRTQLINSNIATGTVNDIETNP